MTKTSIGVSRRSRRPGTPVAGGARPRAAGDAEVCDLYAPGHLMHYTHQADAVHSPSRTSRSVVLDGTLLTLVLDDSETLHWRHHDPERLERIIELLSGRCVVYRDHHALRVGPYWFNCAGEDDHWLQCRSNSGSFAP